MALIEQSAVAAVRFSPLCHGSLLLSAMHSGVFSPSSSAAAAFATSAFPRNHTTPLIATASNTARASWITGSRVLSGSITNTSASCRRRHHHYWSRHGKTRGSLAYVRSPSKQVPWYPRMWVRWSRGDSSSTGNDTERSSAFSARETENEEPKNEKWEEVLRKEAEDAEQQMKQQWERLRLMMERDPYSVFFGRAAGRVWNPFGRIGERWSLGGRWGEERSDGQMVEEKRTAPSKEEWKGGDELQETTSKKAPEPASSSSCREQVHPSGLAQQVSVAPVSLNSAKDQSDLRPALPNTMSRISMNQAEGYHIDPITLRKVVHTPVLETASPVPNTQVQSVTTNTKAETESVEVPVKKYQPLPKMSDLGQEEIEALLHQEKAKDESGNQMTRSGLEPAAWLKREGFVRHKQERNQEFTTSEEKPIASSGDVDNNATEQIHRQSHVMESEAQSSSSDMSSPVVTLVTAANEMQKPKLQAAVDRLHGKGPSDDKLTLQTAIAHFNGNKKAQPCKGADNNAFILAPRADSAPQSGSNVEYSAVDNKTENVDQLRAADIRAAAKYKRSTEPATLQGKNLQECPASSERPPSVARESPSHIALTNDVLEELKTSLIKTKKALIKINEELKANADVRFAFAALYGQFESFRREVRRCARLNDIANDASSGPKEAVPVQAQEPLPRPTESTPAPVQTQQRVTKDVCIPLSGNVAALQTDPALDFSMNEVVDNEHHAALKEASEPTPAAESQAKQVPSSMPAGLRACPLSYRVLAIDEMNSDVISMSAKSSLRDPDEALKTPASILLNLERPERFVNSMQKLEEEGFELIDGDRRMLVFKQVEHPAAANQALQSALSAEKPSITEPIPPRESTTSPTTPSSHAPSTAPQQYANLHATTVASSAPTSRVAFKDLHQHQARLRRSRRIFKKLFRLLRAVGLSLAAFAGLYMAVFTIGYWQSYIPR